MKRLGQGAIEAVPWAVPCTTIALCQPMVFDGSTTLGECPAITGSGHVRVQVVRNAQGINVPLSSEARLSAQTGLASAPLAGLASNIILKSFLIWQCV